MKDKILALLLAKFAGVRKDGLAQLAGTINLQVTTEEDAQALIDKLTVEKVTEFVKDFRADVDKEVSTANTAHETNLKKKFNFVEKKKPGDPEPPNPPEPPKTDDEKLAKLIADSVAAAVKPLQERLAGYDGEKVKSTRKAAVEAKLKDSPEEVKTKILKDFDRMNFEKDEDFDTYLTETETDIKALSQKFANDGLSSQGRPTILGKTNPDGISQATKAYIEGQKSGEGQLAGKELTTSSTKK